MEKISKVFAAAANILVEYTVIGRAHMMPCFGPKSRKISKSNYADTGSGRYGDQEH